MCWTSETKPLIKTAEENIPIFKMCVYYSNYAVGAYYRKHKYELKREYVCDDAFNEEPERRNYPSGMLEYLIRKGFHSYDPNTVNVKNGEYYATYHVREGIKQCIGAYPKYYLADRRLVRVNGYIPKGTRYYLNEKGEYVSEGIVLTDIQYIQSELI